MEISSFPFSVILVVKSPSTALEKLFTNLSIGLDMVIIIPIKIKAITSKEIGAPMYIIFFIKSISFWTSLNPLSKC